VKEDSSDQRKTRVDFFHTLQIIRKGASKAELWRKRNYSWSEGSDLKKGKRQISLKLGKDESIHAGNSNTRYWGV